MGGGNAPTPLNPRHIKNFKIRTNMRAWIEPNDDNQYQIDIDEYDNGILIKAISYIHRPLQWTIENLNPPDYTE